MLSNVRDISKKFCKDFDIPYCQIYYVDVIEKVAGYGDLYGVYIPLAPYHMLVLNETNHIVIVIHELTHHLEEIYYNNENDSFHGYSFQLAKKRVKKWCIKNLSSKADWKIPLSASFTEKEMMNFRL